MGHTIPADGPLARIVKELNNQYGTSHTGVTYNGSGDTRLALINGEVDYALLSKKHTLVVMKQIRLLIVTQVLQPLVLTVFLLRLVMTS